MKIRSKLSGLLIGMAFVSAAPFQSMADEANETAELPRPVTGFYNFEIGHTRVIDTYLSPLPYTGTLYGLSGFWIKALPANPEKLSMTFSGSMDYSSLLNPRKSARGHQLEGAFKWGLQWRTPLSHNINLIVGGSVGIDGGVNYIPRNTNNPANAIANAEIGLSAALTYHVRIGSLPILLADYVKSPLIGAFFMPGYGEAYYEISLGNHSQLAHFGWWGSNAGISNLLSATLDFGRTSLMIGYRIHWRDTAANHLVQQTLRQSFVIGVVPNGLGLRNRNKNVYPLFNL